MINSYSEDLKFELPDVDGGFDKKWRQLIDTYEESPADINRYVDTTEVETDNYIVKARSIVILISLLAYPENSST